MPQDLLNRLGGLLAIAIGVALAWWGIWRPLEAARAHVPVVTYHTYIFVAAPVAIVAGLYLLIGGARWPYRNVDKQTLTPAGWALIAAIAIVSAASFFWLTSSFEALGYRNN